MVSILTIPTIPFESILKHIRITFHRFDITKCDERTLYISIAISTNKTQVVSDLIYLVDKHDLYGAISLNEKYDSTRAFFKQYFNYELLYSDEQTIAKLICQSDLFKRHFNKYARRYPKYAKDRFCQ